MFRPSSVTTTPRLRQRWHVNAEHSLAIAMAPILNNNTNNSQAVPIPGARPWKWGKCRLGYGPVLHWHAQQTQHSLKGHHHDGGGSDGTTTTTTTCPPYHIP